MNGERGLTLLDAVIAVSLLAIAIGLAYPGFQVANETMSTGGRRDQMERAGDRLLKQVVEVIRAGRVTDLSVAPSAPSITVVRLQSGVDLADLDEDGTIPWQATARSLRFRQTSVLEEVDAQEDLNRDGDRGDSFSLGILELVHGELARPITQRARVMLALPGFAGDLDGDGVGDPLFVREGRSIRIRIQLLTRTNEGRLLMTVVRGAVRLRNTQE